MAVVGMIAVIEFVTVQADKGKYEVTTSRLSETGKAELTEYHL